MLDWRKRKNLLGSFISVFGITLRPEILGALMETKKFKKKSQSRKSWDLKYNFKN
jgi:hypothetical protein